MVTNNNSPFFENNTRRSFIQKGSLLVASTAITLTGMTAACDNRQKHTENEEGEEEEEEMVSANEDLMREHGLLQRMLLVYDHALKNIHEGQDFNPGYINRTAAIIHDFVEDYHEKLEEEYLFPRLIKANKLTDIVAVLRTQHAHGRNVTEQVLQLTNNGRSPEDSEIQQLASLMQAFNYMYRPHEAREDTIVFPAFKKVVSRNEYDSLGEEFEKKEHEKFGEGGFDQMVEKVAEIEKQIGIYDLNQFTPEA